MNDNSLGIKEAKNTVVQSELDRIMQSYIDSGRFTKEQLAEMRKAEANKLKEANKQEPIKTANVTPITDESKKEIDKNKKQEERVEKYGGKVDTKIEVEKPGRGSQTIYSKHEGLDEKLQTLDATEEEYVPALNEFYKNKGVDVRFVEANPVWTDWLNVGSSWNSIEVLIGDQKEGEGFKIPVYDKGSASKFGESVISFKLDTDSPNFDAEPLSYIGILNPSPSFWSPIKTSILFQLLPTLSQSVQTGFASTNLTSTPLFL
jgi:hypothetical protein